MCHGEEMHHVELGITIKLVFFGKFNHLYVEEGWWWHMLCIAQLQLRYSFNFPDPYHLALLDLPMSQGPITMLNASWNPAMEAIHPLKSFGKPKNLIHKIHTCYAEPNASLVYSISIASVSPQPRNSKKKKGGWKKKKMGNASLITVYHPGRLSPKSR